jgi:hypothetical protein
LADEQRGIQDIDCYSLFATFYQGYTYHDDKCLPLSPNEAFAVTVTSPITITTIYAIDLRIEPAVFQVGMVVTCLGRRTGRGMFRNRALNVIDAVAEMCSAQAIDHIVFCPSHWSATDCVEAAYSQPAKPDPDHLA